MSGLLVGVGRRLARVYGMPARDVKAAEDSECGAVSNLLHFWTTPRVKEEDSMARIEQSIDVDVPVRTAYNQWTQFEDFPKFMEGVLGVRQLGDKRLLWRANVGGKEKTWEAEITEQIPDDRVAWRSRGGAPNAGVVTFHRLGDSTTRIMLQLEYEPEGAVEQVGDWVGVVSRRVEGDLRRFKEFIESRGRETGAWRGEIPAKGSERRTA
jgi:uncharacterized membrane protein